MSSRTRRWIPSITAAAIVALVALSGCSATGAGEAGASSTGEIASLETASPGASGEAVNPLIATYGEPVRLRLDMTVEEEDAAYDIYNTCVAGESGVDLTKTRTGSDDGDVSGVPALSPEDSAKLDAASEACMIVQPLPPWEYDSENPDAVNFAQAVVDCLRGRGVVYVEVVEDGGRVSLAFGGEDNDAKSISLGMDNYESCEAEVVASGEWAK